MPLQFDFSNAIHKIIGYYYKRKRKGGQPPNLDSLISTIRPYQLGLIEAICAIPKQQAANHLLIDSINNKSITLYQSIKYLA